MLGRLGGEEFALLLPDADAERAFLVAERLRCEFAEATAANTRCTVSVGISSTATTRLDGEAMLQAADQALYAAKALGRDRCIIYSREVLNGVLTAPTVARGHEQLAAMLALAETLDVRLHGGAEHSRTVGRLAAMIASRLGFDADHVERVRLAGILHDIGKVAVPGAMLEKDGPLTAEEWAQVRRHPEIGAHVAAAARLDDVSAWVLAHHERVDGAGYPRPAVGRAHPAGGTDPRRRRRLRGDGQRARATATRSAPTRRCTSCSVTSTRSSTDGWWAPSRPRSRTASWLPSA